VHPPLAAVQADLVVHGVAEQFLDDKVGVERVDVDEGQPQRPLLEGEHSDHPAQPGAGESGRLPRRDRVRAAAEHVQPRRVRIGRDKHVREREQPRRPRHARLRGVGPVGVRDQHHPARPGRLELPREEGAQLVQPGELRRECCDIRRLSGPGEPGGRRR
jgi:hypothetical protein